MLQLMEQPVSIGDCLIGIVVIYGVSRLADWYYDRKHKNPIK